MAYCPPRFRESFIAANCLFTHSGSCISQSITLNKSITRCLSQCRSFHIRSKRSSRSPVPYPVVFFWQPATPFLLRSKTSRNSSFPTMPCNAFTSSGLPSVMTFARKFAGLARSSSGVLTYTTWRATFKMSGVSG